MKILKFSLYALLVFSLLAACEYLNDLPYPNSEGSNGTPILGENGSYILKPEQFTRGTQNPSIYEVPLNVPNIECFSEPFYLTVINGTDKEAVSSAVISIDGDVIFSQSDFKRKRRGMMSSVSINANSVLKIELRGKPGTNITVSIEGTNAECGWEYNYYEEDGGFAVATSFIKTSDGGFIFTGNTQHVVKIDKDGIIEWETSFKNGISHNDIYQTTDGGYVITGNFETMKIDNMGTSIEWKTTVPGTEIIQCSDQSYLLVYDSKIVKLGIDGELLWEKEFNDYKWRTLIEDEYVNGEFIIAGEELADFESELSIMRMDGNGNIIWNNSFTNTGNADESPNAICQDGTNGYMVVGLYFRIHYINYDGTLNWSKTGYPYTLGSATAIIKSDLGFLIGGSIHNDTLFQVEAWVSEITNTGEILKDQAFGKTPESNIMGIVTTNDNYIVFGGYQWIQGLGYQLWAKKSKF